MIIAVVDRDLLYLRTEEFAADEAHGRCSRFITLAVGAGEQRGSVDEFAVVGRETDQPGRLNRVQPQARLGADIGAPHANQLFRPVLLHLHPHRPKKKNNKDRGERFRNSSDGF